MIDDLLRQAKELDKALEDFYAIQLFNAPWTKRLHILEAKRSLQEVIIKLLEVKG